MTTRQIRQRLIITITCKQRRCAVFALHINHGTVVVFIENISMGVFACFICIHLLQNVVRIIYHTAHAAKHQGWHLRINQHNFRIFTQCIEQLQIFVFDSSPSFCRHLRPAATHMFHIAVWFEVYGFRGEMTNQFCTTAEMIIVKMRNKNKIQLFYSQIFEICGNTRIITR